MDTPARHLIPLGEGVYTVSEVCRILQPGMTPRKVHYWLDTSLLSDPIARGQRGEPTLLSFQQLLEIRTVQRIRDELEFSLAKVRIAFAWILEQLFDVDWRDLRFERFGPHLVARTFDAQMIVPGGQGVLGLTLPELNEQIGETRLAWESKVFEIPGRPHVVSDTRILAGAPTIRGTRLETSIIAALVDVDDAADPVAQVTRLYPRLSRDAITDALAFEGIEAAA
jgi:uncharacterized protein (DUF433 family)